MQVEGQQGGCLHSPLATGARVRNAYRTCLILGNSLAKVRLMPDVLESPHEETSKEIRYEMAMRPISWLAG